SAGYAHTAAPLGGFAAVLGVYGIGLLSAIAAGALLLMRGDRRLIALPIVLLLVGALLRLVDWTTPHGAPITVRLLQPNVAQEVKFNPQRVPHTLQQYAQMITAAPADLIATPETALPLLSSQLPPDYLPWLDDFARRSHSQLLVGVPLSLAPGEASNSVIGLGAAGPYHYDKHHLVPFGEFTPLGFRWFLDMMHMPLGDFNRGAQQQAPLAVKDQWIMPNICYEDLFGEEIAAQLDGGSARATMLLNVSNIAWFGNSIALPQHLQISQMRALETGRPMLRATNTGATAVIDQKGRVVSVLAPLTIGTLAATVQGYAGTTPYIRVGNHLAVLLALLMLGAAWHWRGKKPPSGPPAHLKTR
ncbi:MAG: apolipoprotein N-acyltransferase, partial [Pseudomonadota bacterium]|nr:apolipoprotein N-acyltransferase [Pseudomonadota bacterium]